MIPEVDDERSTQPASSRKLPKLAIPDTRGPRSANGDRPYSPNQGSPSHFAPTRRRRCATLCSPMRRARRRCRAGRAGHAPSCQLRSGPRWRSMRTRASACTGPTVPRPLRARASRSRWCGSRTRADAGCGTRTPGEVDAPDKCHACARAAARVLDLGRLGLHPIFGGQGRLRGRTRRIDSSHPQPSQFIIHCRCRISYSLARFWEEGDQWNLPGTTGKLAARPPSTGSATPLTYDASSEARKVTACAISAATP